MLMAHWGLLPKQVAELTEDELEALEYAFLLYERRNIETWSDVIGGLTGTSWPLESLLDTGTDNKEILVDKRFTWSLRPPRKRVSSPLSLVFSGPELLDQLKKQAQAMSQKDRVNPAILSRPRNLTKKGEKIEVIELGTKSKEEFLNFVQTHNLG